MQAMTLSGFLHQMGEMGTVGACFGGQKCGRRMPKIGARAAAGVYGTEWVQGARLAEHGLSDKSGATSGAGSGWNGGMAQWLIPVE